MIVWNFELYMLPISLLVIFLKNMFASTLAYNYGKEPEIDVSTSPYKLSCEVRKLSPGFWTWSDTNQPVLPHKMARSFKFLILKEEGLFYL